MSTTTTSFLTLASAVLSAVAAVVAVLVAYWVHRTQTILAQRQHLLELWQHIADMPTIDPKAPITPQVTRAADVLELIGACCEAGVVDAALVRRIFRDGYIRTYDAIERCGPLPGFDEEMDGRRLLSYNPAATTLYNQLKSENLTRDQTLWRRR